MKYYFTFGASETMPYRGGWVEVYANSLGEAQQQFIEHFKEKAWTEEGLLNYSFSYGEKEFAETGMLNGNLGETCHEVLGEGV